MLENVGLYIENFAGIPYSEDENNTLRRFGKVFQQTYTRFIDLQKAEAQAREAQIEAALEKVRSRSLAMQRSEELRDVVFTLFERLKDLNVNTGSTNILIFRDDANVIEQWVANDMYYADLFRVPYNSSYYPNEFYESKVQHGQFHKKYSKQENKDKFEAGFKHTDFARLSETRKAFLSNLDGAMELAVFGLHSAILLYRYEAEPFSQDEIALLKRFAKVFEQAYTRFLDLQKAETQAREAKIEAALERTRTQSMIMQHSKELDDVLRVFHEQVLLLGIQSAFSFLWLPDEDKDRHIFWAAWAENASMDPSDKNGSAVFKSKAINYPLDRNEPATAQCLIDWKGKEPVVSYHVPPTGVESYFAAWQELIAGVERLKPEYFSDGLYYVEAFIKYGCFGVIVKSEMPEEEKKILYRFAVEFERAYTRFLDLQKAEAQSRESQIELGLERVRARAMAMQNSDELKELIGTVFIELTKLDLVLTRCLIMIYDPMTNGSTWWMANSEAPTDPIGLFIKYHEHSPYLAYTKAWQERNLKWQYVLEGTDKNEWDDFLFVETELSHLPDFVIAGMKAPDRVYLNASFNNFGNLTLASLESLSDEHFDILLRFAKVFDLTYTRFNDLQKAEAQAREAQIEASLERVRSKTMAMHNSQDVGDTVATMFDELVRLRIETNRCGILIYNDTVSAEVWTAKSNKNEKATLIIGKLDLSIHPLLQGIYAAWKNKESFYTYPMIGDDLKKYYQAINDSQYYPTLFNMDALPEKEFHTDFFFAEGSIFAFTGEPIAAKDSIIFKRFAGVFGQTYRRYLDLQKAEAQAREATIEAALEKVRGKAMAMHNSNDLSVTVSMVFTELRKLGINPIRCGVGLLNKESRKGQLYSAASSSDGDNLSLVGWVELSGHPDLEKIYDAWLLNEEYYPELSGEQLTSYYKLLLKGFQVTIPDSQDERKQYGTFLPFSVGCLYAWSENPYNDAEIKILKRFATIIDLTFRRYIELQKSEANAREAVKQAALDRIRADIASMRTINDLDRITPLIWNELTILGVPFIRCGVFIMDELQQLIHTFLSTPDGKAIAAFHLPYDTPGSIGKVVSNWNEKKSYVDHWDEEEFMQFAEILVQQGALVSAEPYLKTIPHGGFYLHFLPFLQGMLYVGNSTQLGEEEISLIQSIADAFSTAYARYEDFNKLEAAKKQVDTTLNELQVTQKQLIQSEKMASLGELTAGIAHEIQNPLNFVNNFSDVSSELVDEMNEEIVKSNEQLSMGNMQKAIENMKLANEIAMDLKQNLEKINHHGKRAGDIVKGMLQHTRSSSGIKEPTDINALADEYLRLSYHGLRAKDKSFNATMKTDFDKTIGNINIIPQDIGRVVLNLINNAFYIVNEKSKQGIAGYEPVVSLITKKEGNKVFISVKDNGPGIPDSIKDKIFQPFFTTKPTGQGTGLGLSLAYDIVKAHGGEIKVETKGAAGSEFIIHLPIS